MVVIPSVDQSAGPADRLRVLVVARWYPSHDAPGRGAFVADQVRALTAAGVEIVVASWEIANLKDPGRAPAIANTWAASASRGLALATPRSWGAGVPVARLPAIVPADLTARHPVDLASWQAATLVPFGTRLAADWPFDLIHAHTGLPDGVAAGALADALRLPLMVTEHDGGLGWRLADERARAAYRSLFGPRRSVVAVSRRLSDQAASLIGADAGSIDVVPNLVDTNTFRLRGDVPRDPVELLWVGTRRASKGIEPLLRAVAILSARQPAIRLRMIGGAVEADDGTFRALADELGITDRVSFEGHNPREAIAAAMSRAGLFVHPSPSESFGIVAIEALASGLPVVAVAPTVADLIGRDGRSGEVAAGPDATSIAAAVVRALDRRDEFDPEVLARAASPFASEAVAAAIMDRYRMLLDGAPPAARATSPVPRDSAPAHRSVLVVSTWGGTPSERLVRLPASAAADVVMVSVSAPDPDAPATAKWIEVDPDADLKEALQRVGAPFRREPHRSRAARIARILRHPWRAFVVRRLWQRRPILIRRTLSRAVRTAYGSLDPSTPIVAVDADDVPIIEEARLGGQLAPAGVRWIADRDDRSVSAD